MKKKSSFKKNVFGIWEKDGNPYPHACEIKTDSCLKAWSVRKIPYKPHELVQYYPETIVREEKKTDEDTVFISIIALEEGDGKMYPIPLCMLDLSLRQQAELIKIKRVPRKAFVKQAISAHAEAHFPTSIEEDAAQIEEDIATTNEILSGAEVFIN